MFHFKAAHRNYFSCLFHASVTVNRTSNCSQCPHTVIKNTWNCCVFHRTHFLAWPEKGFLWKSFYKTSVTNSEALRPFASVVSSMRTKIFSFPHKNLICFSFSPQHTDIHRFFLKLTNPSTDVECSLQINFWCRDYLYRKVLGLWSQLLCTDLSQNGKSGGSWRRTCSRSLANYNLPTWPKF
jgi:hypothetical protein